MAEEFLIQIGEEVGQVCLDFTQCYIGALIKSKLQSVMDASVDAVMPDGLEEMIGGGGDEMGDIVEEKKDADDDEKEGGVAPFASGVTVISWKTGKGPDSIDHRYYNIACWAMKPEGSVIIKTVSRHTQLLSFTKDLKKNVKDTPKVSFPAKKLSKKRSPEFYKERMKNIHEYFEKVSVHPEVMASPVFLQFFNLMPDAQEERLQSIFLDALQDLCQSMEINWERAQKRADKVGVAFEKVEMLKMVAIEKVGGTVMDHLKGIEPPSYLPGKLKDNFLKKAQAKMFGVIAQSVEKGWGVCDEAFNKVAATVDDVLEKAVDKIKEIIAKVLEPLGKIIKEKFGKMQEAITISNDDLQGRDFDFISRFKPLGVAMKAVAAKPGKVEKDRYRSILKDLLKSVDDMKNCHLYVGYLQYQLADPMGIVQYLPWLEELGSNHNRLTIALTDCAYILSRAAVRAFVPLAKYLDECSNDFDTKTHGDRVRAAVRESGRKLAIDYFSLPKALRKTTSNCGRFTADSVLKLAQQTIVGVADVITRFATNWTPTDKDDVAVSFVKALEGPLNAFLNDRVSEWLRVTRRCMQDMVAIKVFESSGAALINDLCESLDELCSQLPDPLGEYLKPGALIMYLFNKMVMNAVVFGVKWLAKRSEQFLYSKGGNNNNLAVGKGGGGPTPMDKALCASLRSIPRIRGDDISFEIEIDDSDEEEEEVDQMEVVDSPMPDDEEVEDEDGDEQKEDGDGNEGNGDKGADEEADRNEDGGDE